MTFSDNPQPVVLNGAVRAFEDPIGSHGSGLRHRQCSRREPARVPRHRTPQCNLHGGGDDRFRESPRRIDGNPANVTRTSQPVTISVLDLRVPRRQTALRSAGVRMGERYRGAWNISRRRAALCASISIAPGSLPAKANCSLRFSMNAPLRQEPFPAFRFPISSKAMSHNGAWTPSGRQRLHPHRPCPYRSISSMPSPWGPS